MNKLLLFFGATLILASCQTDKTAFVDNKKITENFDKLQDREAFYKEAEDSLKVRIELMVAQSGYQDLVKKYQTEANQLSEAKKEELYGQIVQLQQSIGQQQQFASQELQQRKSNEIDSIVTLVKTYIKDYGKENGYTYIFGSSEGTTILYGNDQKDISDEILEQLNAKYPVEEKEVENTQKDE